MPPEGADQRLTDSESFLRERIARWEPELGALLEPVEGRNAKNSVRYGPLAGINLGIKDVIDVAGFPTRNGSAACSDARPASADAPVVAALRRAGARIVAKTATTEFAFTDPTSTLNPFDPSRTPGGSSSGSGAAVGAGILDLAIGTQTAGSLIRPAAYCGAVAFKPSFGKLPTAGMTPLAPSFDTIGFIARSIDLACAAYGACGGEDAEEIVLSNLRVGVMPTDARAPIEPAAIEAIQATCRALIDFGASLSPVLESVNYEKIVADHRLVMLFEAAQAHWDGLAAREQELRPGFRAALRQGMEINDEAAAAARERLAAARAVFWGATTEHDVLIASPTPGPAPKRDGTTGYQHMLTPWTVFAGPLVALPWGTDSEGLPLSVMLATPPGTDARVLGIAAKLADLAPPLPAACPR